jgi:hypothetical protein
MKREDLMKADLLSEIVLLTSGVAIIVTIVMVLLTAVASAAAMQ